MKISILYFLLLSSPGIFAQEKKAEILSPEVQINTAVLAAPEDERSGVMVYGYDKDGKLIVLREGSNNLICLADDPN